MSSKLALRVRCVKCEVTMADQRLSEIRSLQTGHGVVYIWYLFVEPSPWTFLAGALRPDSVKVTKICGPSHFCSNVTPFCLSAAWCPYWHQITVFGNLLNSANMSQLRLEAVFSHHARPCKYRDDELMCQQFLPELSAGIGPSAVS